ncbi:hypothetical protein BU17DRAFT_72780 [Hysterangium stoloniferum]|nr:hypothetical protein BU17DRAFT_72780 [Hysterangium stoloniferum]
MSNRSQLPPDTQRSSSSQSANQSSIKKLHHVTTRRTSPEDEQRQDREVLENTNIAVIRLAVQLGLRKFNVELAIPLLGKIAETANPPLLPDLKNADHVRKCIVENDELFDLLGECLQKESFSEIRSLEMFQPFVEAKYVSDPLQAFELYTRDFFERFLTAHQDNKAYYGLYLSIVQSSGTGKSRLISEVLFILLNKVITCFYVMSSSEKNDVFVVHMTLRDITDKGFPPRDDIPANLLSAENAKDSMQYESRCSAFFTSVFKTLESTIHDICTTKCDDHGRITFSQCVGAWQKEFGSFAPRRREFFAKIYNTLEMRNLSLSDNCESVGPGSGPEPAKDAGLAFSGKEVMTGCLQGLLPNATPGATDPEMKVVLGFDEAAILRDEKGSQDKKYITADIICRAISIYSNADRYPIWAVFASTNSRIADFAAPSKIHPSLRVSVGGELLFRPFTELGFDQSAPKFSLDSDSWPVLNDVNHISGFGRPLWSTTNACAPISELVAVAKRKLMLAHNFDKTEAACSLALVSQRFALDVVFGHPETVELLLLFAKDHYLSRSCTGMRFTDTPKVEDGHLRYCSAIPVNEWLTRLFGERAWPTDVEQNLRARQTFNDYEVNFSHWISMQKPIAPFDGSVRMRDQADVSYIQRTNTEIDLENGLPWISISMDLGLEAAMRGVLHRDIPPPLGAPKLDRLPSQAQFARTSGTKFIRWDGR